MKSRFSPLYQVLSSTCRIEKKRTHKIINPAVIRFVLFVGRFLFLVTLKRITDGTNHISEIKVPWWLHILTFLQSFTEKTLKDEKIILFENNKE